MAARIFFFSILFTEVLRPACLAGVKGVSGGVRGLNRSISKNLEFEESARLGFGLETELGGDVVAEELRFESQKTKVQKRGDRGSKGSANDKLPSPESYHCVVKNNVDSLRSSPYLAHDFNKSPQNVTVREGEVAQLFCSIDSIPSPSNLTWQYKKQPLSFNDKTKYFMVSPGVLYINATKLSDAGSYRCVATNKFFRRKTRKSKKAMLSVNPVTQGETSYVPTLLFPQISYNYELLIGSNLTLVCASSGFPTLVTWTFTSLCEGGATVGPPRLLLNSTNSIAVLLLKTVTVEDAGEYQCSVKRFGKTLQTQNIAVDVLIPPTFVQKPENRESPSGKSIRFECQAQGRPTPQIQWLKNCEPLDPNPRQGTYMKENNKMELAISSTIPNDSGMYQCVAVNAAGEIWAAARLQISYLPQSPPAPTSLRCRAVSPHKILLFWETPRTVPSSNIASWTTVHYAITEPGSRENIIPEENSSSIEVTALEPFTNYSMYVRKWNKQAASNQSAVVQCSTAASVPIAAPSVIAHPISSTKLNVSWLPLNRKEARGYIVEYKLQWRLKDHPSTKVHNLSSAFHQYMITDLLPGAHYEVRVVARTKQGWPNLSESRFNWTRVTMPLANSSQSKLTNLVKLDVINVDASTIKVKWKMNESTDREKKNFKSWKLYYQNEAGKELFNVSLPKNCTEWSLTELEADVLYGIGLCMISSGESEVCLLRHMGSQRLNSDYAPGDVEGIPASSTSINVSWSAVPSGMEHCYEVCYKAAYSTDSETPVCLNTTDVKITVRGLKPYTLYQFKVRGLCNTSEWETLYGETIECYTNEDVPGAVRDVNGFLLNITKVRITWKQPSKLNGVIHNYTVFYISNPWSTPPERWANVTVPGINTNATLQGLTQGTRYFVEVRAATSAGYGKSSERIIIHTGVASKNLTDSETSKHPPPTPVADQSLGIIVGVSISTCCIIICISSIYCRRKWENTQSPRESSHSFKDRVILRNGNGCCVDRNSVSASHHVPTAPVMNEVELAVLYPPSPETTNPHDGRLNGISEPSVKEPLLRTWDVIDDSRDLNITENPQYKPRICTGSSQQPEQELDDTQLTTLNYTADSSGSSLNNNLENSESLSSLEQLPSSSVPVIGPNG